MPPAGLEIEADLALVVTTPDGRSTTAHVVGEGSSLRITAARPDVLLGAVDRADVGPLADALDAVGISVHLDGPGGRVATIGSAASSRFGRLLTGSANTDVARGVVLRRAWAPAAAVASVAAAVALVVRASRRR
ncbi:MAG: hypothetical protein QOK35_2478 [Pseudonocardiales bacterium]|nr:hypothetical protein [Pseudonocardiales bacterium]